MSMIKAEQGKQKDDDVREASSPVNSLITNLPFHMVAPTGTKAENFF
jgi:hypothetical protein